MNTPKNIPAEFSDWLDTTQKIPQSKQEEKANKSGEKEIEERCNLLLHLNNDRREVTKRIKQNIRWEFEIAGLPDYYNNVDKIIDRIFDREKIGKIS